MVTGAIMQAPDGHHVSGRRNASVVTRREHPNCGMLQAGNTALHIAAKRGDMAEVVKLLQAGADSTKRNKVGHPGVPILCAVWWLATWS
jgi:hypothetical protein